MKLQDSLRKELRLLAKDLSDELDDELGYIARDMTTKIKQTSPVAPTKGKHTYAAGWRCKHKITGYLNGWIVYNATDPGLTHLLEKGHEGFIGTRRIGRVEGKPHVQPARDEAEKAIDDVIARIQVVRK